MKLTYKSRWYKIRSVTRYLWARAYYGKRFQCARLSMIGEDCGIHIFPNAQLRCRGRIIVDDHVMIYTKGLLSIGRRFRINRYSRIVAREQIEIGDNVVIGQQVAILDHDHQYKRQGTDLDIEGYITAPIKLGSNIWIGDKCTILKGVTIGDNVIVGAHTLIHKDVPDNVVVGGVPFRILKEL